MKLFSIVNLLVVVFVIVQNFCMYHQNLLPSLVTFSFHFPPENMMINLNQF